MSKSPSARGGPGVDLHLHSDVSDGLLSPADLVGRAARTGIVVLALTDHDATDGVAAARAAAPPGMTVVPAVELTCRVRPGALGSIHVVGLGIDPAHAGLEAAARRNRQGKRAQIEAVLARLRRAEGIHIAWEDVAQGRGDDAYVGRNQVAAVLLRRGHARTHKQAFSRFLDARHVPHVDVVSAEEALAALHAAGGVSVLAHPTSHDLEHHLDPLRALGLRGIEVWRPHAIGGLLERIEAAARAHGLLASGGSDWHGHHPDPPLGSWRAPADRLAPLLAALGVTAT